MIFVLCGIQAMCIDAHGAKPITQESGTTLLRWHSGGTLNWSFFLSNLTVPMEPKCCAISFSLTPSGRPATKTMSVSGSSKDMESALYAMPQRPVEQLMNSSYTAVCCVLMERFQAVNGPEQAPTSEGVDALALTSQACGMLLLRRRVTRVGSNSMKIYILKIEICAMLVHPSQPGAGSVHWIAVTYSLAQTLFR